MADNKDVKRGIVLYLDGKEVKTMQPGGIYVVNGKKVLKIKYLHLIMINIKCNLYNKII